MARPERPLVTLVVARARNGVIGRDNALPWHLPEDLRHFKATTMGRAIVMGRRTFESIGRVLPGRRTIVVSRSATWSSPGSERAATLEQAIELAGRPGQDAAIATDEVFVIGGAQLFEAALSRADRALVTEIDIEVEGNVHFAPLGPPAWRLAHSSGVLRSSSGLAFRIDDWRRVKADERFTEPGGGRAGDASV
jgi:dihydrofolate reductase